LSILVTRFFRLYAKKKSTSFETPNVQGDKGRSSTVCTNRYR